MRVFGFLLLSGALTMLILWWAGPLKRWAEEGDSVTDEWLDKLARDLRTHRGGHWRA